MHGPGARSGTVTEGPRADVRSSRWEACDPLVSLESGEHIPDHVLVMLEPHGLMLSSFVEAFHAHYTSCPNQRLVKGIESDLGALPDPSLAANDVKVAAARALLGRLEDIDRDALEFGDALDLDLAELMLRSEINGRCLDLNGRPQLVQLPRAGDEIGDGLFLLMANDRREPAERLTDIRSRLEAIPAYLDRLFERLDRPVARWVNIEMEKVDAMPDLLRATVAFAEEAGWPERTALEGAANTAQEALERYRGRLGALETTRQIHIGEDATRRLVALRGIEPSLEELHRFARDFLAETQEALLVLRGRLVAKYGLDSNISLADLHAFLNTRFAVVVPDGASVPEPILSRYEAERARILAFIHERALFPVFEDQHMKIIATPSFLEPTIPAGAMMSPPPFRGGTRTSLIFLTIKPDQLDDHTELGIPGMMIHEGIPGHHLQLATASQHPSIIRRHVDASEHAEGWTTMLEDYMLDLGYMGDLTDEARFVGKRDLSRMGARVAIDLFFMTGERSFLDVGVQCDTRSTDPFEAAGTLLAKVTGFNPGRVQGELNWYSQERGYPLCYLTGNKLVWRLKEAAARGPSGLSGLSLDRRFHQVYLEAGNMPLAFLRRVMVHEDLIAADA